MTTVRAFAAKAQGADLEPFEYQLGTLGPNDVDIRVTHCGICHSDLSMLDNEWGMTQYPLVPGHEIAGVVDAVGEHVPQDKVKPGDRVGLGWCSASCMHCPQCLAGDHNMCTTVESTIIGRHGGFADRVRCHWVWATKLPAAIESESAGPLLCGGITVFNPLVQLDIKPTDRVGVIGIGGLGHMALAFYSKWGCEVTAFTSSDEKRREATELGAHRTVNSRDPSALEAEAGKFHLIVNTANADLPWDKYLEALAPKGHLHTVGVTPKPIPAPAFPLISGQKSISGSPLGSPATTAAMLDFAARHRIKPVIERFQLEDANDALQRLRDNKARYRVVLEI